MEYIPDERTLVIVGSWNLAILNPFWVAKELFEAESVEVEVIVGQGQSNLKFAHENVTLTPRAGSVVFSAVADSDDCLLKMESLAARLLELLPLTPVSAVGLNFGLSQQQVPDTIAQMFNTADVPKFAAHGLEVKSMSLVRHLAYDDRELRLRLTLTEASTLKVHLNFHKQVGTATLARAAVLQKSTPYRDFGLQTLTALYDLSLENAE